MRSATRSGTWWRRPWVLPAMVLAFGFIIYSLPPYLTFDPNQARLPNLRKDLPFHYPLLVLHIMFGTIAMATVPFQLWPWLRRHHPAVHRTMGRLYVFVGVLPASLFALAIVPLAAGPVGNAIGALLWLGATLTGWRMARRRRYVEHRRFMIYSFALCMQIIEGRVMVLTLPHLPGFDPSSFPLILETASWIGVLLNLLAAQWWLERTARQRAGSLDER